MDPAHPPATPLALNPGQKRKSPSSCKCCLWLLGILASVTFVLFLVFLSFVAKDVFLNFTRPHRAHLYNATAGALALDTPIHPLIGPESTFDIAVSVFLVKPEEEIKALRQERRSQGLYVENLTEAELDGFAEEDFNEFDEEETLLYSEVPARFHNLKYSDKHVVTEVALTIPTSRFCGQNISAQDLRASFVLLPNSPSKFDSLKNFSSIWPTEMYRRPRRSWPFPLHSTSSGDKTLQDLAVESFGISTNMILFETDPRLEPKAIFGSNSTTTSSSLEPSATTDAADDDDDDIVPASQSPSNPPKLGTKLIPPHRIPHVITRTELRLIQDASVYSLQKYNQKHNDMKAKSCGQNGKRKPHWRSCNEHPNDLPFATRFTISSEDEGKKSQRAYAPALALNSFASGPLDHIKIPINRTGVAQLENGTYVASPVSPPPDCVLEETLNVTWKITFRARTPTKAAIADIVLQAGHESMQVNASDYARASSHGSKEFANGVLGHRWHLDSHPRRRFGVWIAALVLGTFTWVLTISYFYTRTSTVGVSAWTNLIMPPVSLFHLCYLTLNLKQGILVAILPTILTIMFGLPELAKLKNGLRLEIGWREGWTPRVSRLVATHWERASSRIDRQIPLQTTLTLAAALWSLHYFLIPRHFDILPSRLPTPTAEDLKLATKNLFVDATANAIYQLANIHQLLFNDIARTFGGMYKSTAYITLLIRLLDVLRFVPAFTGRWDSRGGMSLFDVVELSLCVWQVWQAWTLPSARANENMEVD